MGAPGAEFILSSAAFHEIRAHCLGCLPEEACGLLGGSFQTGAGVQAQVVLPVANTLHSPVRFRMDPEEQLKAFYWLDEHALDLVGIFHSHPSGPEHPSATDLTEFAYPGVFTLILSPHPVEAPLDDPSAWLLHAFDITGVPPVWTDVPVRITGAPQPESF